MKSFILFATLFAATFAQDQQYCYRDTVNACDSTKKQATITCNAKYAGIDNLLDDMQDYAFAHIARSHEYLLMATHYANVEKNRPGFEKLFHDLSDEKWSKAIELIKHITKRGGAVDFSRLQGSDILNDASELYELQSVAMSLDMEKTLARTANKIHKEATNREIIEHDPEISSYMEEEFAEGQANHIRKLAGYAADLSKLLNGPDAAIAIHMFDEYLLK